MRLHGPRSIRARAVLSAGVGVLIGSALVSLFALLVVRATAYRAIDDALSASVTDASAQLTDNPPAEGSAIELPVLDARDPTVVQVVDATGSVVAGSPGARRTTLCAQLDDLRSSGVLTVELAYPRSMGTFRALAVPVSTGGRHYTVCAARSVEPAEASLRAAAVVLALVVPVITLLVCLLVARQVGRALTAVSDLSGEAERLRTLDGEHLTVPATHDEVEALAVTLNGLLDRLHEQSSATQRFIADAGHELRTPLTSLRLALDLADEPAAPWVEEAHLDVDRMSALVDDLLALARSDSGVPLGADAVVVPDDLSAELRDARRLRPDVLLTVDGPPVPLVTDAPSLRRAVRNLLANAVRHAESSVTLVTSTHDGFAVLQVFDDGPGIPADQVTRVFERFVRLDAARDRDAGGTGLGLSIVASYAAHSGGTATAGPGPGGRFELRIPIASHED